ncbi:MAG: class I SAM-dependent methyltransferase, partial [Acidobacteriota bacterium]
MADLSVTALYTSQVWAWAGLPCADLCATRDAKRVFDLTNLALAIARKPPLRVALLHRHLMIDHLLREAGCRRVVELAAGLSTRGARTTGVEYVEVDLPAMIARKRELLARSERGREVLARVKLVEGDVTQLELAPLVAPGKTLVIAEGLVMYLRGDARRALFARLAALATICGELELVFDLVPAADEPPPGLAGRALEAAMKRFTGGQSFERDARTRAGVLDELRAAGFATARAYASRDVARAWQLPHGER